MGKIRNKIDEIAKIITEDNPTYNNYGLLSGSSGKSLFLYHYAECTGDTKKNN